MNILIVDDDIDHQALVERFVKTCGDLQCRSAMNGIEAVKCLQDESFDVVVTDLMMPEMDGMQLLKYCREHHPDVDVIVMTGFSRDYSYVDVIEAGAKDFIEKPFHKDELCAKLERTFREKRLIEELKKSKDEAEAGNRAKTAFLCTIGHELWTPMNGILGFTGLLGTLDLPPEASNYISMINKSADRLMKLLNQVLDFSAIEAGNGNSNPVHFKIKTVLQELLFSTRPKTEEKGIRLEVEPDGALAELILFGDQLAISQILFNLTDNAVKFTESGSIKIGARKLRDLSNDLLEIQFSVSDTGCGLDPEKQEAIFEPFVQGEDFLTRKHDGAGLGLATCVKLTNRLGGKMWLESSIDKGSTFFFTVRMASV